MARAILDSLTKVSGKQTEWIQNARTRLMTLRQSVLHLQYFHNARDPSFSSEFAPVLQIVDSILMDLINPTEYFPLFTAAQVTWLYFPALLHKHKRIENLNAPLKSATFKSHFLASFNLFTAAVNSSALADVLPGDLDFGAFERLVVEADPTSDDIFTRVTQQLESIFEGRGIPFAVKDRADEFFAYGKYLDSTVWLTRAYDAWDGADLACECCRLWFQLQRTQLEAADDIENSALQQRISALERDNESLRRENDALQKEAQVLRRAEAAMDRVIEAGRAAQAKARARRQHGDVQRRKDEVQSRNAEIRRLEGEVERLRAREDKRRHRKSLAK
jgi:hypothetical protein